MWERQAENKPLVEMKVNKYDTWIYRIENFINIQEMFKIIFMYSGYASETQVNLQKKNTTDCWAFYQSSQKLWLPASFDII